MSEQSRVYEEVKNVVKALLDSAGRPMSAQELARDYHEFEGKPLPLRLLGKPTFEQFLLELHDYIQVVQVNRGTFLYRSMQTKETSHIVAMVQNQKPSQKSRAHVVPPWLPPRFRNQQPYNPVRINSHGFANGRPGNVPGYRAHKNSESNGTDTIPGYVQSQIVNLLRQHPGGMQVGNLGQSFQMYYGYGFSPNTYGFDTWFALLTSMNEVVTLINTGSAVIAYATEDTTGTACARENLSPSPPMIGREPSPLMQNSNQSTSSKVSSKSKSIRDESSAHVSEKMKAAFQEILAMHTNGIWCSHLPEEYEKLTTRPLDTKDLGYYSVIEMVTALQDVFTVKKGLTRSDWLLYDARTVAPQSDEDALDQLKDDTALHAVPLMYQRRIVQVISSAAKGMFTSDFEAMYKKYFGDTLDYGKFGFYSMELLLKSLPQLLEMTALDADRTIVRVVPSVRDIWDMNTGEDAKNMGSQPPPSDAVTGPYTLPQQEIDSAIPLSSFRAIYVTNITNPGDFWIQHRGAETSIVLDQLMDSLEEFYYGPRGGFYFMPFSQVFVGQLCVATFPDDNNWHRCTVLSIKNEEEVELFYVDYGSLAFVHSKHLRYITKDFAKLPAQGIHAYLGNIAPANGTIWSPACKSRFNSLVEDKPLMAAILTNEIMIPLGLCLCDTSSEEDLHVNDTLVCEGLAVQIDQDKTKMVGICEENGNCDNVNEPSNDASEGQIIQNDGFAELNIELEEFYKRKMQTKDVVRSRPIPLYRPQWNTDVDHISNTINSWYVSSASRYQNVQTCDKPIYMRSVIVSEDITVQIISLSDELYLTSGDMSAILWPYCQADIFSLMLAEYDMRVSFIVINKESHSALLDRLKTKKMWDKRFSYNGNTPVAVTLYPAKCLSDVTEKMTNVAIDMAHFVLTITMDVKTKQSLWSKI